MKKTIITLILVLFSLITFSQTKIKLRNNTDKKVYATLVYQIQNGGWTSFGWYTVDKYSNRTIDIGNYTGDVFVHGRSGLIFTGKWGRGYTFCIDENDAFRIYNANEVNCKASAEFSKLSNVLYGSTTNFTFNP